jgi:pimeloyl-ACP methyl ester carboxylesterase
MASATAAPIESGQYAALSNGTRLHYASAGQKGRPLMLFIHGFPEFWYEWEAQLQEFGQDYFAVAPDMRGFNLSDQPADAADYKARLIIDDLRLLTEHLGYERFVLVAHDWGGAIAWSFALAHPGRIEKLIIVNSPHPWLFYQALCNDPEQQQASAYMNWLRKTGSEYALAKDNFALLEGLLNNNGRIETPWFTPEVRAKYHECWGRGLTGGVNFYRASPLYPPTDEDAGPRRLQLRKEDFRITVPTRVIWGEQDAALPKSLADGLLEMVDDLQVARIPEGSHWVIHEQPERVNGLIRGFLAD